LCKKTLKIRQIDEKGVWIGAFFSAKSVKDLTIRQK